MSSPASQDLFALISVAWSAVLAGQLPPNDVLTLLISKALGYGVIAGACITKVPQIQLVLRNRSAEGLSFLSFELEALCLLIHISYGYVRQLPFSTYGEAVMLGIQMLILLALTYRYGKASSARIVLVTSILAGFGGWVLSGSITQQQMQTVFSANTAVYMAARVPQIWQNYSTKNTGQLSLITNAVNVLGCLIRVFTTISEKAGSELLRQHIIATLLNAIIVAQILLYSRGGAKRKAGKRTAPRAAVKKEM